MAGRSSRSRVLRAVRRPPLLLARPSILLVTLDTTRADAIGPEAKGVETPAFNALAARGVRFRQAQATVPETLPSHASMMTGLYPAGHGIHENARYLSEAHTVLAERLRQAGYRTAACVSSFILARRFGLAHGFEAYDDELSPRSVERTAAETTARALAQLGEKPRQPLFMWVHYFDPHAPYTPPEPFRSRYAKTPYLGEVAAMDQQLGRLVQAFEALVPGPIAIVVAGDHGEGLGDHGESQHGNLLYQSTMRVPLLLVGPGVTPSVSDTPVSTRRVFHTILDWAGLGATDSLRGTQPEVVLGEAMKPFLAYGWQPQVMAIEGQTKAILAGRLEAYDLVTDPKETRDLGETASLPRPLRTALREYPAPSLEPAQGLREPQRRGAPEARQPRLRQRRSGARRAQGRATAGRHGPLFDVLEQASGLFVRQEYARVIPLLERILAQDPYNLDAGAADWPPPTPRSGRQALALVASRRRARSHPAPRTSKPTSHCTTRAATERARRASFSKRSWPRLRSGCQPSRRSP